MRLGAYELETEIGRGATGVVFRARAADGRAVAVKVLNVAGAAPATLARFEREQRLQGSLGPGFVPLLDAGTSPKGLYLVMPLLEGGTLRDRLARGPLGVAGTVALGVALARALGAAHERGIVHRDVKPENVLFAAKEGTDAPLLADLGLAKHFDPVATGASQSVVLSKSGAFRGTPAYVAPEQIADASRAGPAADVFALGAVLYECLAGRPAFLGDTLVELLARVADGSFEPLGAVSPETPPWLVAVVHRALARDAAARFANGEDLAIALERGATGRESSSKGARPVLLLVVGVLLLIVVGLAARAPGPKPIGPGAPPTTSASVTDVPTASLATVAGEGSLGWFREVMPRGLRRSAQRPIYVLDAGHDVAIEMVYVPAGDFLMGSTDPTAGSNAMPQHTHPMPRYWIGRSSVTWGQYLAFCGATGRTPPEKPFFWEQLTGDRAQHPVVNVSWLDATAFCEWAGTTLQTEAEWEKAACGTDASKYPWGPVWDPKRCNYLDASCPADTFKWGSDATLEEWANRVGGRDKVNSDGYAFTSPAGAFPDGESPFGALDMIGNVWNWCRDDYEERAYDRYAAGDMTPPAKSATRTYRGSGWTLPARLHRVAVRGGERGPTESASNLGFRVVLRGE